MKITTIKVKGNNDACQIELDSDETEYFKQGLRQVFWPTWFMTSGIPGWVILFGNLMKKFDIKPPDYQVTRDKKVPFDDILKYR